MSLARLAGKLLAGIGLATLVACNGGEADPVETESPPLPTALATPMVQLQTSLSTTYYDVTGVTTDAIFGSIEANGPTNNTQQRGSGLTTVEWEYGWTSRQQSDGSCSISNVTITADMTIELPQHVDEASLTEATLANWREYARGVASHEQTHVDIYLEGANEIKAKMEAIPTQEDCDALDHVIETAWAEEQARINGLQEAFHTQENLRVAARRGPLEQQIEQNRAALDGLQSQIALLTQEIEALREQIDALDDDVYAIDAQVQQIYDQFPHDKPPEVQQRLEELLRENNELLTTFNAMADQHNQKLAERSPLVSQYDALLAETNELVDEFNWSR